MWNGKHPFDRNSWFRLDIHERFQSTTFQLIARGLEPSRLSAVVDDHEIALVDPLVSCGLHEKGGQKNERTV